MNDSRLIEDSPRRAWLPPGRIWIAVAIVATLHALPFLVAVLDSPTNGTFLKIGYNRDDTAAYLALANHPAQWPFLLFDPFTTEPQQGRFIILFLSLLGWLHRITGISLFTLFEVSRIPLLAAFTVTVWQFLGAFAKDRNVRVVATWLALLAGGFAPFMNLLAPLFREDLQAQVLLGNGNLLGWSGFNVLHNPLWICGYIFFLLFLRFTLQPRSTGIQQTSSISAILILLFLNHPYSGIAALVIYGIWYLGSLCFSVSPDREVLNRSLPGIAIAILLIGIISLWQRGDAVFAFCSGGVFGPQETPVFWYPVAFGAVGVAAVFGIRYLITQKRPELVALSGWIIGIALLHSSPLLNGYHFVPYLFLPVCILAATPLTHALEQTRSRPVLKFGLLAFVFLPTLFSVLEAVNNIYRDNAISTDTAKVLDWLKTRPAGNVLCPPALGAILPTVTGHRVWCGQWFLTPRFKFKGPQYQAFASGNDTGLNDLIREQSIRYLVFPNQNGRFDAVELKKSGLNAIAFGSYTVIDLSPGQPPR